MSFVEINLFGVYVAPIVPLMIAAFAATAAIRWVALASGMFRWIWHPALLQVSVYLIVLAALVVAVDAFKLGF